MPIYEYHCEACGCGFECLVFRKEEPAGCPLCNSKEVNKLMSACGYISKGSDTETVKASDSASSCNGCLATSCAGGGL